MSKAAIPYNRPAVDGRELDYLREALTSRNLSGDGPFTKRCNLWLEQNLSVKKALLTHSCTAAMEMAVILGDIGPGDEVIMPSFTFSSTANAVVLRGARPVFVDIRPDTMNLDESLVEEAITARTKAIFAVHYAGVACEMDALTEITQRRKLLLLEDAAQAFLATYKGRQLGTIGEMGAFSFHETKNIVSGEGGALLINNPSLIDRAEIIREKGTNRHQFFRGQVDKYTWVDLGSSFLPSELIAAVLAAQLERAREINSARVAIWRHYFETFADLEKKGFVKRPTVPKHCEHNGHIFYLLAENLAERTKLISVLKEKGIAAPFHYIPLHSAPAGKKFARTHGSLAKTDQYSERLLRLPLWVGISKNEIDAVITAVHGFFRGQA